MSSLSFLRVGVLGGGQLALMMYEASLRLNISLRILAASPEDAVCRVVPDCVIGSPFDRQTVLDFAQGCDVITLDHEQVDADILREVQQMGVAVHPDPKTVRISVDKAAQRTAFANAGLPQSEFVIARDFEQLQLAAEKFGYPFVLKPARGGYDGRGVFIIQSEADLAAWKSFDEVVLEPLLDLTAEAAVQVARRPTGEKVVYPVVHTEQVDGMCRTVDLPSGLAPAIEKKIEDIALSIADLLDITGIFAVEFFICGNDVFINEIATRPHNSGHHTIDTCVTSQFENHLRAVLDLPLGSPAAKVNAAVMANLVGTEDGSVGLRDALPADVAVHLYGKTPRPGRKLGHVTAIGQTVNEAMEKVERAVVSLPNKESS